MFNAGVIFVFVKYTFCLPDGGNNSPRSEGQILHWQENLQKQEEAGKGDESPQGTTDVTTTVQSHDSYCNVCVQMK